MVGDAGTAVLVPTLIAGSLCGIAGGAFSWLLLWPKRRPISRSGPGVAAHPIAFAGACGLVVAGLGWLSGGDSFGSGYAAASQAIAGRITLEWHVPLTCFFATLATYFSGMPGGIFAPALAIGTAIGSDLSGWIGLGIDAHTWIALCMVAFIAAVTRSPITAAIIVMEMVDGHRLVIGLMAAAFVARGVSGWFGPELYQQLATGWLPPGEPKPGRGSPAPTRPGDSR